MALSPPDWTAVFQQAALDPSGWLPALQRLADATGSARGQLIGVGGAKAVPFNWINDFSDAALAEFVRMGGGSPAINFRIAADAAAAVGSIVHEGHYRRARSMLAADTYIDYCRDEQIMWGCHAALIAEPGVLIGLALLRSDADSVTDERQRADFAHAARAAQAAVRLQRAIEDQGVRLLAGTLETMTIDGLLIDGFGRVGAVTGGAQRHLATDGTLALVDDRLTSPHPDVARRIDGAMRAVLGGDPYARVTIGTGKRLDLFGLARRDWAMSFAPRVIAVIRNAGARLAAEAGFIAQAFGLSRAEAEIARLLARGLDRASIAAGRGVTLETLKSQIKSLYRKTGCGRESEVVALIAGLTD